MSSFILVKRSEFVANFIEGEGFAPKQEPLPVVNAIKLAPPAICSVAETGSNLVYP